MKSRFRSVNALESTPAQALELSVKDGSIVASAGLNLVMAEMMKAQRETKIENR